MKILYAIQGTGNGHISRALELIPSLQKIAEIDLLLSGTQSDIQLPWPVKYQFHGISLVFGNRGNVTISKTLMDLRLVQFLRDIIRLNLDEYDLVISDFEPVSAWTCLLKNKACLGISHQAAFRSKNVPLPRRKNLLATLILRYYAYTSDYIGFHFKSYDATILAPIIRRKIREATRSDQGHITVYLPAFADKVLIEQFAQLPDLQWQVFSKHATEMHQDRNVLIHPIDGEEFSKSLIACHGLISGGGFETPAEAMYLGKKIMLIPMSNQYEQIANAVAARQMGCMVVREINTRFSYHLMNWLEYWKPVDHLWEDPVESLLKKIQAYPYHKQCKSKLSGFQVPKAID